METLAPLITAGTTAISILAVLWIYRRTHRFNSIHALFGAGTVLYTMYHFYACGVLAIIDPVHGMVTSLFIISAALVNAYSSTTGAVDDVNIGICRRKTQNINQQEHGDDRRQKDSHTIFEHDTPS